MHVTRDLFAITAPVEDDWIDYNGHLSVPYYALLFDRCAESFYEELGLGRTSAESGRGSLFSLEHHTTYLREVLRGAMVKVTLQLLDWDAKRIHYFMTMTNMGTDIVAATSEQLAIHVNMASRSSDPLPPDVLTKISAMRPVEPLAPPEQAGHIIRIRRKRVPSE